MAEGSWTLSARATLPSSSDGNWASIFQCAGPELTGHDCSVENVPHTPFPPALTNANGRFPDVVSCYRTANPKAKIGYFFEWGGMRYMVDTNAVDRLQWGSAVRDVADWAADYFRAERPELTILVINSPDDVGHKFGWGSPEYQARIPVLDRRLAKLVRAVEESGVLGETVFIVTSDHGGIRKRHGGNTLDEIERPLILAGKGVKKGFEITEPNASYDVGATLAWLLGVEPPSVWRGRPVTSAFQENLER